MCEHLIAYIRWNRITAWKILSLKNSETNLKPFAFGSKQPIFKKYAKKGNVIWVFSIPMVKIPNNYLKLKYRPTLVAKITINEVADDPANLNSHSNRQGLEKLIKMWKNVAIAETNKSEFFELNDATELLLKLKFNTSKANEDYNMIKPIFDYNPDINDVLKNQQLRGHIGKELRFIRRIYKADGESLYELEKYQKKVKKRSVFISYALADANDDVKINNQERSNALALADQMLEHGWSPWLDSLVINPRDEDTKKLIPNKRLQKLLEYGIDGCAVFIALISNNYIRRDDKQKIKWTLKELDFALNHKENRILAIRLDKSRVDGIEKYYTWTTAEDLAKTITKMFG